MAELGLRQPFAKRSKVKLPQVQILHLPPNFKNKNNELKVDKLYSMLYYMLSLKLIWIKSMYNKIHFMVVCFKVKIMKNLECLVDVLEYCLYFKKALF